MKIEVIPFASDNSEKIIKDKTVVMIDVLRASSVMITALLNGAKQILPFDSIESTIQSARVFKQDEYLLCGERNAEKINGFHLGNSPLDFTTEKVNKKTILMSTTNGTHALKICRRAEKIIIGAFLNVKAVCQLIGGENELILLCAGTKGKFSLDDAMCAAMIIEYLSQLAEIETDDLGQVLWNNYKSKNGTLTELLEDAIHVKYLKEIGFTIDIGYCLQTNITDLIPLYEPETNIIKAINRKTF